MSTDLTNFLTYLLFAGVAVCAVLALAEVVASWRQSRRVLDRDRLDVVIRGEWDREREIDAAMKRHPANKGRQL